MNAEITIVLCNIQDYSIMYITLDYTLDSIIVSVDFIINGSMFLFMTRSNHSSGLCEDQSHWMEGKQGFS